MRMILTAACFTLALGATAMAQNSAVQEGTSNDPSSTRSPNLNIAPTPPGEIATTGNRSEVAVPRAQAPAPVPVITPNNDPATAPVQDGSSSQ